MFSHNISRHSRKRASSDWATGGLGEVEKEPSQAGKIRRVSRAEVGSVRPSPNMPVRGGSQRMGKQRRCTTDAQKTRRFVGN